MFNQVELQYFFRAPIERVYHAFTTPDALTHWLSPFAFFTPEDQMSGKAKDQYKVSFINFPNNISHSLSGRYFDIEPLKLILYKDRHADPNLPDEILVTVQFRKVEQGSEVRIVQENTPTTVPAETCYRGWQDSLVQLAKLVEPEKNL